MIKRISALILVTIMTFSLAACGGDGNEVSSTASDSQVVAEVESAAEKEDVQESSKQETTASKDNTSKEAKSETANTSSKQNTASKITGVVSGGTVSKVTVADMGTSIKPIKKLNVNAGDSISQNIDLKGKTITMAITADEGQYHTKAFERCVEAFEIEYNCKVKIVEYTFADYNQRVQTALATDAGAPDICFTHGSYFPTMAIDNIYEPLNDYLYQGDVATSSTSGGIDLNKTSYFVYKNKIYGTCNFNSAYPYLIYYNKKKLADAGWSGARDPRKLAENGKWTWAMIQRMGKELSNASEKKFFLSGSFTYGRPIPLSFGAQIVVADDKGGYKQNITSQSYINALKFKQEIGTGSNAIVDPKSPTDFTELVAGKVYMWCEESSKYVDLVPKVKTSSAFGRNKGNLGIVEMPLGGTNKNRYPTGWLTAVACGKGKDPRVAIAWDVFRSKYTDPNSKTDETAFSAEDKKYIDSLLVGDICLDIGRFYSSDTSTEDIVNNKSGMDFMIRNGGDITKWVSDCKDQVQACIDYTIKR